MKLAIAAALAHHPELLILDEATSGLDPIMRDEMLDVFLEFVQEENHSILLSSHITSDLEKVADYITFIHNGKLIMTVSKNDYVHKVCEDKFQRLWIGSEEGIDLIDLKHYTQIDTDKELPGLAIVLDMPIQGADEKEQFAILTKSFGEFIGLKNSAYVDINNCPFAPQLLNRGFAKDTGLYKESGFCSYPLWTFEETVLKETGGEKYERYARAYDEYMESSFIGMMGAEDETGEEICTGMMM